MSSINTNLSAITALQSLKSTQNAMNKNQSQISTGLRVGEAPHNASYWSISTKMKSDNGALGAVKDSIKQSKAMIDTYTSAIDKSLKFLDTMKTKLTAGSNPGADLAAIQLELKSSIEGLKSAAASATFNGQNWLSGDAQTVKLVTSYDGEAKKVNSLEIDTSQVQLFDDAANPTGGLLKAVSDIDVADAKKAPGYADISVKLNDISNGDTLDLKLTTGSTNQTVQFSIAGFTAGDTLQDLADIINPPANGGAGEIGAFVEASVVDGKLRLTSKDAGTDVAANFMNVQAASGATDVVAHVVDNAATAGVDETAAGYAQLTIDADKLRTGDEIRFTVNDQNAATTDTEQVFKVGGQKSIGELVASINADTNLNGKVKASEVDGKLRLTTVGVTHDVSASFAKRTSGVATTAGQLAVADSLKAVDRAINDLRAGSAMLGANKALLETQEEFIGVLSDSLTAGVSAFIDADMNEVSTRNQALQTQQQLGVQALSMANQNSQMILKLFQ